MYFENFYNIGFYQARALSAIFAEYAANCSNQEIAILGYNPHGFNFIQFQNGIKLVSYKGEDPTYIVSDVVNDIDYEYGELHQALHQLDKLNQEA